jgi:hypothetical protein
VIVTKRKRNRAAETNRVVANKAAANRAVNKADDRLCIVN